ncbi:mediator of RNA polymerase II transcription subunit 1-like [Amphibalanus amphitrite]|uniref:mediator of RNA polymerase II transcription subunit 1-like n=1 Tax=Amphibalanus amphitrite TaxID=1232801 RepID=UPI001C929480|nr:mediator of RNA polymerase II transcription subunit 1-like [Amphibalanus amphitrite]XP_043245651.1 mediator of RNA polymerase II transcription subunit 1-like [Amphibalanus amphitrite]XP_043245652.1 mediator of RNA polymerase II transcription subunit 1-like [Amphibalanus amphitrite]
MEDKAGWKVEMLMEKLRAKSSNIRTLQESSKNLRLALMDKRQTVDSADRAQLQKCLDQLQGKVKFHSLQGMLDRLESVAKQLGIKFRLGSSGQGCFIECDMFYVELELHSPSGQVREVKIQHQPDQATPPQPCPELVKCLTAGDFAEFTAHLEGLLALYKLNADRKLKMRAYPALRAMEEDLSRLAAIQATSIPDPRSLVHRGPVGIVQLRRLGHPMRLTYMVTPYHLLDVESRQLLPLTVETVTSRGLGLWAEVCLQSSTAHKLQTTGLISVEERPDGKSVPVYSQLSSSNSCTLPATFVLKLSEKMAMSAETLDKITEITSIRPTEAPVAQSLLSLIARVSSDGKMEGRPDQPLYVQLPDALHCYYMEGGAELVGAVVDAVPFTHPAHVPPLLTVLRAQALFNTLVASCVRTQTPKVTEGAVCMELTAMGGSRLSISFEHPQEDALATLEVDLSSSPRCRLHTATHSDFDQATAVLQKCLSIPVTMRALMKRLRGAAAGRRDAKPGPAVSSAGATDPPGDTSDVKRGTDAAADSGSSLGFSTYPPFGLNQMQGLWPGTTATATASAAAPAATTAASSAPASGGPSAASTPAAVATPSPAPTPSPLSAPSPAERPRLPSAGRAESPQPPPPPPPPPAPQSEMEGIEATVRQLERERARRPADEPSPRAADKRTDLFSFPGGGQPNIPPSLTITPIPNSRPDERKKERKDKERSDKKRRRDESPGGRTTPGRERERERGREGGGKPMAMKQGASPPAKKHSSSAGSSPNKSHGSSSGKSSSPVPKSKSSSSSSSSSSSKHGHLTVSPKHSSSPKHPSASPKHGSSPKPPSSGKPSLSSLRSPSPSHQSSFRSSGSSGKSRDKSSKDRAKSHRPRPEREGEGGSSSRSAPSPAGSGGGGGSGGGSGDRSSASSESKSPGRSRKTGLLNDVISKLNNTLATAEEAGKEGVGKDGRRTEFTVKPSSEGIKLTINKTKSRSSSSSPSSGSRAPSSKDGERNSPSGLKPGVASGPASKKTFVFPKQSSGDGKHSSSSTLSDLQKSLSAKMMKRPESASGVRPRSDKHRSDKTAAELAVGGDLPPLPKSLEIRKIERPAPAEPSAPSGGGADLWPPAGARTASSADSGDMGSELGGEPRPPPPPRPPPVPRASFPPSPSVQIHIVKSPAPVASPHQFSSLVSPHSSAASPCVIDDELMDEALVGGK